MPERKTPLEKFRAVYAECLAAEVVERDSKLAWQSAAEKFAALRAEVDEAKGALVQEAIGFALNDYLGLTAAVESSEKLRAEGREPDEETVREANRVLYGERAISLP